MKYFNSIKSLVVAAFVGIASVATAQTVHPLSFGVTSSGLARANFYKDYVGIRFQVTSPSSISGDKIFTTPNDGSGATGVWGGAATTMTNVPVKFATPDTDACSATAYAATLFAGKIALVWRGNCEFGAKALKAQNGGAVAVVIVNNVDGGPVGMAAGAVGASVTIPVYMISLNDGRDIAAQLNAGTTVNMTIVQNWGTGQGSDLGFVPAGISISANNAMPFTQLNAHSLAYKNKDGAFIANYGTNNQTRVKLKSELSFTPSGGTMGMVKSDSVTLAAFPALDSIYAMYTAAYDVPTISGAGRFDLKYSISSDSVDAYSGDNTMTYSFYATDSLYSKGRYDFANNKPVTTTYTGPSTLSTDPYMWSVPYYIANSGSFIKEVQFSVVNGTGLLPTGDQFFVYVFKWVDAGATPDMLMENSELQLVGTGVKVFGGTDSAFKTYTVAIGDTLGGVASVALDASSWYVISAECPLNYALGCDGVLSGYPRAFGRAHFDNYYEYYNPIWFGNRANSINAAGTATSQYANPNAALYPWAFDGTGSYDVDSVVYDAQKGLIPGLPFTVTRTTPSNIGVNHVQTVFSKFELFPNPATNTLNVSIDMEATAKQVTYSVIDGSGKFVSRDIHHDVKSEVYTVNTTNLATGNYFMIVTADGRTSSKKFVVAK